MTIMKHWRSIHKDDYATSPFMTRWPLALLLVYNVYFDDPCCHIGFANVFDSPVFLQGVISVTWKSWNTLCVPTVYSIGSIITTQTPRSGLVLLFCTSLLHLTTCTHILHYTSHSTTFTSHIVSQLFHLICTHTEYQM